MVSESIHQPHDKTYKAAFSDVRVARDFLSHHLSKEQQERLDLNTLSLCSGSFISPELQKLETDILYSIKLKNYDDEGTQEGLIYLLLEHMSTADPWLPLRLLGYLIAIWEYYRKQNPKVETLPLIMPVVLYHGDKVYPHSMNFFDLFGKEKLLAINMLTNPFKLVDLHTIPDEKIREHTWCGLVEFMLKNVRHRNALSLIQEARQWFVLENARNYLLSVLTYVIDQGNYSDLDELFRELAAKLPKTLGEEAMTIGEQLRQQGRQQERILVQGELFENLLKSLGDEEKAAKLAMVSLEDFRRALKMKKEYEATKH